MDTFEEYVANTPTGVEVEDQESIIADQGHDPWNPEEIRIHTKSFSLRNIVDMVDDKELDLSPDFQRNFTWKEKQQSGLIESLLLGIPLPSFYFDQDRQGYLQVVDGVQRITTINNFIKGKFQLGALTYLKQLQGKTFDELELPLKRRLNQSQFVAHVIDPQTPYKVKFDIFRRINTGGEPLSSQEIRHCMSKAQSRDFLKALANSSQFLLATGGSLKDHVRMADREVVLRAIAFHLHSPTDYLEAGSLDVFLGKATQTLDSLNAAQLYDIEAVIKEGLSNSYLIFGENTFRKWPLDASLRKSPINRALCEVWCNVLARYETQTIQENKPALVMAARQQMTDDYEFIDSISGSTGAIQNVLTRFKKVQSLVSGVINA